GCRRPDQLVARAEGASAPGFVSLLRAGGRQAGLLADGRGDRADHCHRAGRPLDPGRPGGAGGAALRQPGLRETAARAAAVRPAAPAMVGPTMMNTIIEAFGLVLQT